ncbi:branched-chain amino acid ABC transporter substrate-binding protein [Rhodoferax ferrireducens]|uniref:branched-chain amino acid ABC transporter substrate-binding protein n=1 Tax=Rhodoferax ferrireducens TaxID=192843 RepID=UPI000E0DCC46|nr:branched-chain amino acid ABC transporter substrate-binding protein [Rhodoferax ferrireducens]
MAFSSPDQLTGSAGRLLAASVLTLAGAIAQAASWNVTLLEEQNSPALERQRLDRAYLGHPGGPAADGWTQALDDARFELEAARTQINWKAQSVATLESARAAAQQAEKAGHQALVVNLPASWVNAIAAAVKVPVINVGSGADSLREAQCRRNLLHTLPSDRMRADALSQTLVSRKWSQVLVLAGPSDDDRARAATVQASLRRYGLKVVVERPFKLSTDPRERELANPKLLTGGVSYDVVWVVDADGEFARTLPYNTMAARPVVGDAGLVALGWHAQFERYGAPQVSRRMAKTFKRAMTQQDWASWMAGKAISLAATGLNKAGGAELLAALNQLSLDGSKGVSMQFRPWDGQLQQTMLLTDGQGVIGTAPVDGVLHPRNALDTLGTDSTEKRCPNRP